jgi:hypothetical protein
MIKKSMALTALALAQPALAQDAPFYWKGDRWYVSVADEDQCAAISKSIHIENGDMYLFIMYNAEEKKVGLNFTSKVTKSLPNNGSIDLKLVFVNAKTVEIDEGWGERTFYYNRLDNGDTMFVTEFGGSKNVEDILDDMAKNTHVVLEFNGDEFTGAQLDESALAIEKLRSCSFEIAGLDRRDPFAR